MNIRRKFYSNLVFSFFLLLFFSFSNSSRAQLCDNWLNIPDDFSFFKVGDLDVAGDKITIEATFNRTVKWNGQDVYQGDLVSKHQGPNNINYLLRPSSAEITTTNGYYKTPEVCAIELNKTYHVAMVYDGVNLSYYRNGILMSQIAANGKLFQNDFPTQVGLYFADITKESFIGFINEVRIWNVARTQQELQLYINSPLPNPASQIGLLGYYTFDNLINKQGNASWNGSLSGNAKINSTNTNCELITKSAVNAGSDTSVCAGDAVQLNATGVTTYSWSPSEGLSNVSVSNPVATVSATTTYFVAGTTSGSCSEKDTITIFVLPKPNVTVSNDTVVCANANIVQLNATGAQQYQWMPSTGLSNPFVSNPIATVTSASVYIATGTSAAGCSASDTVTINISPKPKITASNDTTICSNSPIQLNATGASSFYWSPSSGLSNPNISNPVTTLSSTISYVVTGTNEAGCSATDTIVIHVLPKPVITLSNDTLICLNSSVQLNANGGNQYQWYPVNSLSNPDIANPVAAPLQSTKYFVTVTAGSNCSARDSIKITVKPAAVFWVKPVNTDICSGSSIQMQASGGDIYLWQPSNNLSSAFIPNPVAMPDSSTTYKVSIKDTYCDSDTTLTVQLKVDPKPAIFITKDGDFNCSKPIVQLSASGGNTYSWTPAAALNNPNISNPVAVVPASTMFYVTMKSNEGCEVRDSIRVEFTGTGNSQAFQLPTAFTPNGDGLNDCFGVRKWGNVEVEQMEIYNRWGSLIFKGKGYNDCWDGTINGKHQSTGAYAYLVKVKTVCGEVEKRGVVMLIR